MFKRLKIKFKATPSALPEHLRGTDQADASASASSEPDPAASPKPRRGPAKPAKSGTKGSAAKAHKPLTGFDRWLTRRMFLGKMRMRLYEKLARFISNGVPITNALDEIYVHVSVEGKKPKATAALVVDEWRRSIRNGRSLARAIQGWVPTDEVSVIDAGEISGRLDKALGDVIFINLARKRIRAAIFGLIYPMVLVTATCFYLYIFGTEVVPAFTQVLPVDKWKGTGAQMAKLANFVRHDMAPMMVVLIILLIVSLATLGTWTGRLRQFFDRFPPWSLYRLSIGSSFLISLSALLHAGVPVPEALRIIHSTASPWYRERLSATRRLVLNGARNIGDALHKTGYKFPSWEMVIDIRSYASLDGFEDMLDRLSHQWLDESVSLIQAQMDVLRNIAIVVMGLMFMWIAAGMFALQEQISNAAH